MPGFFIFYSTGATELAAGFDHQLRGFDFTDQRRECMEKWAQRIAVAAGDNVISLDGKREKSA